MNGQLNTYFVLFFLLINGEILQSQNPSFIMSTIGSNALLHKPWDLEYGPDGYLWVTERERGIVSRINPISAIKDELIRIPDIHSSAAQDGLLGMAIQDGFLGENPYVYLSYTKLINGIRKQQIVRYTYDVAGDDGSLISPMVLIENLPASNDHNSGRLIFGPDQKLYYTIGDQGHNQNANYCDSIMSQVMPTQEEINNKDWARYPGKILRLNIDGSIPSDNPEFNGVRSHIFTYGHRNPQGLVFGKTGKLYSDEHGPNSDDEVNLIEAGGNYGWPIVVGYKDDQGYDYCNWSSLDEACQGVKYVFGTCPANAELIEESSFTNINYKDPLMSLFAVKDDYNYNDPRCQNAYMCRPNVAPSSLIIYESDAIPSWTNSLLVTSLKRGRIYRLQLDESGSKIVGDTLEHFYTQNRYRDIVISPDGKSFFMITDESGNTASPDGLKQITTMLNPGALLRFTLDETVSSKSLENADFFKVFPNPANGRLTIEINDSKEIFEGEFFNSTGHLMQKIEGLHSGTNPINISSLPAGIYILKLSDSANYGYKKVLIME